MGCDYIDDGMEVPISTFEYFKQLNIGKLDGLEGKEPLQNVELA